MRNDNKYKFFAKQILTPEVLNNTIDTLVEDIGQHYFIHQEGIIPAKEMYNLTGNNKWQLFSDFEITAATGLNVNIGPGVAINKNGELIIIPTDDTNTYDPANVTKVDQDGRLIPQSSGHLTIPIPAGSTKYIYISYLKVTKISNVEPHPNSNDEYTLNTETGDLNYIHYVNGYNIELFDTLQIGTDKIYLGKVTADIANVYIDMSGRTFAYIPATYIKTKVPAANPTINYNSGDLVSIENHINSVGDITAISKNNPHGITINSIPDLANRFNMFSTHGELFNENGLIDKDKQMLPIILGSGLRGVPYVSLNPLLNDQYILLNTKLYSIEAIVYSEIFLNNILQMSAITSPTFYVDFPTSRANGVYYIVLFEYTVDNVVYIAVKAIQATNIGTLNKQTVYDLILHPEGHGIDLSSELPVYIVNWQNGSFAQIIDPFSDTMVDSIDIRKFGYIGNTLIHNTASKDIFYLDHNLILNNKSITVFNNTYSDKLTIQPQTNYIDLTGTNLNIGFDKLYVKGITGDKDFNINGVTQINGELYLKSSNNDAVIYRYAGNNPYIKYNNSTGTWRISNDGTSEEDINMWSMPRWLKFNVDYSKFSVAGTQTSYKIYDLPAGAVIHMVKIKHSVAFNLSPYYLSVGIYSDLTKYTSLFDVSTAISSTNFYLATNNISEDHDNTVEIYVQAVANANLNGASAGVADIWLLVSIAK